MRRDGYRLNARGAAGVSDAVVGVAGETRSPEGDGSARRTVRHAAKVANGEHRDAGG
jgi:hypothetical protein